MRNAAPVTAVKKAMATGSDAVIVRLILISVREILCGVNVCLPFDYKPELSYRYGVRCEGHATYFKYARTPGSNADIDRLISIAEREIVRGVNICPPVDYKPEHSDRYCVRCEGFAECTARNMRLNRPKRIESDPRAEPVPEV